MIQTLADALAEKGYETLTPVQEAVTDPALAGRDMLVSAQTGSGKTVGFGLAIADTLLDEDGRMGRAATPLALIVAPTRELAFQVQREITWLYAKTGAQVATCVGGMDMRTEKRTLERGAHIVVGTPGRLRDHIQRNSLDLSGIRAIVLDEADEMLDLGFREDLEFMLGESPDDRRTLMFSATVPPMIATLAKQYQRDAARVNTAAGTRQHADIEYQALNVSQHDAEHAVINLLLFHDAQNALVFANTRAMVARLTARLTNRGFATVSLSGELSQSERTHALQAMRDGRARVCVATDVAARGIDLPNLELVIHAELPSNSETLLHRSGRTGRAGRKGISALIVAPKVRSKAQRLLKFAKLTAEWTVPPSADDIVAREEERLLTDPAWTEAANENQEAFATKLSETFTPMQLATAYLRLHQSRRSAPEDLSPPDSKPARAERAPREFGPSVWFTVSVGRNERAEARWLLPLLCRAGDVDKNSLGAIRVQETESFVELAAADADRFVAAIGDAGELEGGVTITRLATPPTLSAPPRRDSGPRDSGPRERRAPRSAPASGPKPAYERSTPRSYADTASEPKHPPEEAHKEIHKPRAPRSDDARGPARSSDKPHGKSYGKPDGKPGGKSFGKPGGKPYGKSEDRPHGKPFGKSDGKPGGKPYGKSTDGGAGKSYARADGPAKAPEPKATDTSKRFVPPGAKGKPSGKSSFKPGAKPGGGKPFGKPGAKSTGKPAGKPGGNDVPRRPKG
ncbi:DEAD/DEAH box helicase [Puniceibacterium sp. IMCC21224]|uniref:DEAD/DEAH box helicase n=1 Tax=Puniceibacterium sp. IMCC21224 TaxID=1618204 RepID=UPI00064DD734|nr:DEAD/DEAH box helicase [Puniceibacterium sp. IMCC21224]KMK66725.1 DNA/RNA helicase, superfamily II [Puniceibacterium sp. IMCC21224]